MTTEETKQYLKNYKNMMHRIEYIDNKLINVKSIPYDDSSVGSYTEPKTEEEKEYMRTHFSIIDLNRVYFKLRTAKENEYPFKISFYTNSNSTTLLHKEYYYSKKLAEQRIKYLQEFAAKRELGAFWYDNNYYDDIGRIVYVTRLKNGNNLIQSLDGVQTSKTDRAHYLDLLSFIQHEFIR